MSECESEAVVSIMTDIDLQGITQTLISVESGITDQKSELRLVDTGRAPSLALLAQPNLLSSHLLLFTLSQGLAIASPTSVTQQLNKPPKSQ